MTGLLKEHIFQRNSTECGPCCLAMTMALLGRPVSVDAVIEGLGFSAGESKFITYVGQLGAYLEACGVKTRLHISNHRYLVPEWIELGKDRLIEKMEAWRGFHPEHRWNVEVKYLVSFLSLGGEVSLVPLSAAFVREILDRGSLVIACLDEVWIWGHRAHEMKLDDERGTTDGHFVVITGHDGEELRVLDPYPTNIPGRCGCYSVNTEQLVQAVLMWDGMMIEVIRA